VTSLTSVESEEMYKITSILSEEMYKNTSILSEEVCLKHAMYLSTKLNGLFKLLWLCCKTVPCLQTALHVQLSHNRFSKSGVNLVAKCLHPEQSFVKLSSHVSRPCEWSSSLEDKIVA
jgi:hypothetical protein